jgi:hypothetical protein
MLDDKLTSIIIAFVSRQKRTLERNGEIFANELLIALCQEEELELITPYSDLKAESLDALEEYHQAHFLLCKALMKLEETLCKEEVDDQLSLPL